ncbi:hypothetical protein BGW80DRAFT_1470962 [Lactifluus volemus]|nr:hypothetical protein BGW80DRAFT_1470962 [Lactifluus volemus]
MSSNSRDARSPPPSALHTPHPSIPSALCRCKNPHSSPSHYLNAIQSLVGTYLLDLQFVMSLVGIEGDREDDRIADVIPPAESAVQVVSPMRENYHVKQDTRAFLSAGNAEFLLLVR